jgi:tetratricopeptide (TPR) repeat protein
MNRHHFISYSSADAQDFALRLCDELAQGPPTIQVWLDKRELVAGSDWDDQIVEAIRDCASVIFVMTRDSVTSKSVCKKEWTRALKYKKPIIPILRHPDAEMPFSLEPRQHIDFTGEFDPALARLRNDLQHLSSPAGLLQQMKDRLADAQRDLPRAADEAQKARIQDDIAQLERQIADQQKIVDDPEGAARRVQESIERGLERERKPERPVAVGALSKFINPPPGMAPSYFQDRHVETKLVGDFLNDESLRMMTVVGRGGVGKTAMVCRLLKSLEHGRLPDELGPMSVDGIVYLSATGSRRVSFPNIFADLCKLLPDEVAQRLDALYKNPQAPTEAKMRTLLEAFPAGRTVLLLDNFEDLVYPETLKLRDPELDEALRALLNAPHHAVKAIITTRFTPRDLLLTQPSRQRRRDIDDGLESPYAENILREMDADGKLGLKTASDAILSEARERTRGYPRALEALFAILSADRDTSLQEVLNDTEKLLPEHVVEALVGEAFSRLDPAAQQVMQALAIYGRPVTPAAIDYLLQPHLPGVNSAPVLSRLVNMQFARKEAGHYYLHPVDRAYALSRAPEGDRSDRENGEASPYTQFALLHRGAEYFKQARTPRENWKTIEDLAPQLAEFDLRCEGQDYDTALDVLLQIDFSYLMVWGHYRLTAKLHDRLQGKLAQPSQQRNSGGNLGSAYVCLGQYQRAIECYEKALDSSRKEKVRWDESALLGNLGICYFRLGQTTRAIEYVEQSIVITRETGDHGGEGDSLGNLGVYYASLGQPLLALDYYQQSLAICREVGDREGEGIRLGTIANVLIDQGRYEEATQQAQEAANIATEIKGAGIGSYGNTSLACAHLYSGNLSGARAAVETALQYDEPENNGDVLALLGLITLRQGDALAAQEAFATAVSEADGLLAYAAQNYIAMDTKGLALCGLSLCDGVNRASAAIEAYKAARAINKDAGIVARVLRLFDALAVVDSAGALKDVRTAAAGE